MTAFECISYLKAFPFPDEFTRRRQRRRFMYSMCNQFHFLSLSLSLSLSFTLCLLTFTYGTFHLYIYSTILHTQFAFFVYSIFDTRFRFHIYSYSNLCIHTLQSHLYAVNFSCRCREHFTTQKYIQIYVCHFLKSQ